MINIVDNTKIMIAGVKDPVPVNKIKEQFLAYHINEIGGISVKKIDPPILVKNQPTVELIFDTGDRLEVTQDIKIQVRRNKEFKRYQELDYGSLLLFTRRIDKRNNYVHLFYLQEKQMEHNLVAQYYSDTVITSDKDIHHEDYNRRNNSPTNLTIKDASEHRSDHTRGINHHLCIYSNADLIRLGINLALELGRRFTLKEWEEKGYPRFGKESLYRGPVFGCFENFAYYCAEQAGVRNDNIPIRALKTIMRLEDQGYEARFIERRVEILTICKYCGAEKWRIYRANHEYQYCNSSCKNKDNHKLISIINPTIKDIYQINAPNLIIGGWIQEDVLRRDEIGLIVC